MRLTDDGGKDSGNSLSNAATPPPCKQALTIQKAYSEEAQGKPPGL